MRISYGQYGYGTEAPNRDLLSRVSCVPKAYSSSTRVFLDLSCTKINDKTFLELTDSYYPLRVMLLSVAKCYKLSISLLALNRFQHLQFADLRSLHGAAGLKITQAAHLLMVSCPSLQALDISNNIVKRFEFSEVLRVASRAKKLKELYAARLIFTPVGQGTFKGWGWLKGTTIRRLDLSGTDITAPQYAKVCCQNEGLLRIRMDHILGAERPRAVVLAANLLRKSKYNCDTKDRSSPVNTPQHGDIVVNQGIETAFPEFHKFLFSTIRLNSTGWLKMTDHADAF